MTQKLPINLPASEESERAILGAVLLDNSAFNQAAEMLTADEFFLESHRQIFRAMCRMSDKNVGIDLFTLFEELTRDGGADRVGGASYLSSLTDGLPRFSNVEHYAHIVMDKARRRSLYRISELIAQKCLGQDEETKEILDSAQAQILAVGEDQVRGKFQSFNEAFYGEFTSVDDLHDRNKRIGGIETGFREFDDMTRGLQPADLVIIAARPSVGKTAWALDVAREASIRGKLITGIFSLEMSIRALVVRLLCAESDVDAHRLQSGFASQEDWPRLAAGLTRLVEAPIFIDDTPGLTATEMRAKARRLKAEHGLNLLIVDYMQLMGGGRAENRTQEISAISRGLKGLAKELNIPVIAVSQLSRASENRGDPRPRLSDLRESGQIEQDADLVAFIFREEMLNRTDDNHGKAELIIAKQRNGPTGTISLAFVPQFSSFRNPA